MSFYNTISELSEKSGKRPTEFLRLIGLTHQLMYYYKNNGPNAAPEKSKIREIERVLGVEFIWEGYEIVGYKTAKIPTSMSDLYSAPLSASEENARSTWETFKQSEAWGHMSEEERQQLEVIAENAFSEIEDIRDEANAQIRSRFRFLQREIRKMEVSGEKDCTCADGGSSSDSV